MSSFSETACTSELYTNALIPPHRLKTACRQDIHEIQKSAATFPKLVPFRTFQAIEMPTCIVDRRESFNSLFHFTFAAGATNRRKQRNICDEEEHASNGSQSGGREREGSQERAEEEGRIQQWAPFRDAVRSKFSSGDCVTSRKLGAAPRHSHNSEVVATIGASFLPSLQLSAEFCRWGAEKTERNKKKNYQVR